VDREACLRRNVGLRVLPIHRKETDLRKVNRAAAFAEWRQLAA
jgi:hypothetical protein